MSYLCRRLSSLAAAAGPSVATLLHSCNSTHILRQLHARIIRTNLEANGPLTLCFLSLSSSLFYPSLGYSLSSLLRLPSPSPHHFNLLFKIFADRKSPLPTAFSLFTRMRSRSAPRIHPDEFTFPSLLRLCVSHCSYLHGLAIHCMTIQLGLEDDPFVCTALINFYGKMHKISCAEMLFNSTNERNEVFWTSMLSAYIVSGRIEKARILFDKMPNRNLVTWNTMISGYARFGDLVSAKALFNVMPVRNTVTFTVLIDGYAKSGDMASAKAMFERLENKDLHSWSAMISGYVQNGCPGEALKTFVKMHEKNVKPDEFVLVGLISACAQLGSLDLAKWVDLYVLNNTVDPSRPHLLDALIDMHAKCGHMDRAAVLFNSLLNKDLISYCSMMQGYSVHGLGEKAVELFNGMIKEGILPDEVAFTVVLAACSQCRLVEEGRKYFCMMKNEYSIKPSADHYACMVDLLGRSGRLREAYELINSMPVEPQASAWGALLGACKLHCDIELGEMVANRLFKIEPQNAGNYVMLSNIYAAADKWPDVSRVRTMMRGRGLRKVPGCTWI